MQVFVEDTKVNIIMSVTDIQMRLKYMKQSWMNNVMSSRVCLGKPQKSNFLVALELSGCIFFVFLA